MAKINIYPIGTPKSSDLLVGTSIPDPNTNKLPKTKNFKVSNITSLIAAEIPQGVPGPAGQDGAPGANGTNGTNEYFDDAKAALVIFDRAMDWLQCYPAAARTTKETFFAFQHFQGPSEKV